MRTKNTNCSLAYRIPEEKFKTIVKESTSCAEVARKIGYKCTTGGGFIIIRRRIKELKLSISHWNPITPKKSELKLDEVFAEDTTHSNHTVKRKLLKFNLIPYKCSICGNDGIWNGEKLILQLDHVNGDHRDNRIENLRFLCPNCHSQTETFAGKNCNVAKKIEF